MPTFPVNRLNWKKLTLSVLLTASLLPAVPAAASDASDRMNAVLELLAEHHVSGKSEQELSDAAIKAMVEAVNDPYTSYMSAAEMKQFKNNITRNYIGIGVEIGRDEKGIYVADVFKGSPAEAAGLRVDDYIVKAGGKDLEGSTIEDTTKLIKGEENTQVALTVRRGTDKLELTVTRKAIQLPILESAMFDGVGYLKLYSFSEDADEQFYDELYKMKNKKEFRSLVVDLRDNPGGVLETAAQIAGRFIEKGVVLNTKTSKGPGDTISIEEGESLQVPVYLLVNEGSASASEVLAGALQDHKAATVAGAKTFGKGSVQHIYEFSDGSYLKITFEEYMTPNGHPVHKVGITPDLPVEGDLVQLLTVLRKAGVTEFRLEQDRSALKLNGMKIQDGLPSYRDEEGRVWIHSRVLAALIGADAEWLPEESAVRIKPAGPSDAAVFSEQKGNAAFHSDMLFLDAAAFRQYFPAYSFQSENDGAKIELQAGKGME